jgi:phosphohistidine phosphatase
LKNLEIIAKLMKTLILMRHGDAPQVLGGDQERVLSSQGIANTLKTSQYLQDHYNISHILCSSAMRNRQTLDCLQTKLNGIPTEFVDSIYKNDVQILEKLISSQEDNRNCLLLIGHNPSLFHLALQYDQSAYDTWHRQISIGFKPAEIIVIEFDCNSWIETSNIEAKVVDIFIP